MSQTPTPGYQPGQDMNPKAAARAAKAYAKATRPWYKKKRFIIPIALVALIVLFSALSGGGDDAKSEGEAAKDEVKTFQIGETVSLAGTEYTVTKAKTAATVGSEYAEENADGIFIVVNLTIENKKDETKTFDSSNAKVIAGNGKSYSTDDDGSLAVAIDGEESLIFADMQPDVPKKGTLVFDVPKDAVKGSKLVVSDFWGDGEAAIDLRLK